MAADCLSNFFSLFCIDKFAMKLLRGKGNCGKRVTLFKIKIWESLKFFGLIKPSVMKLHSTCEIKQKKKGIVEKE
jgi:hypothetical protein